MIKKLPLARADLARWRDVIVKNQLMHSAVYDATDLHQCCATEDVRVRTNRLCQRHPPGIHDQARRSDPELSAFV